jgi:hypothetical protein
MSLNLKSLNSNLLNRRAMIVSLLASTAPALAQRERLPDDDKSSFSSGEIVGEGHKFFGGVTRGFASAVESVFSRWGKPNGYILGQEGSGALIVGLRYGEGQLFTKRGNGSKVFWQGPSLGIDAGGDGDRTMMLIYKLGNMEDFYERFGGVDGSAYVIGGFGVTALTRDDMVVVPIRTGLGLRLGFNVGYLKFSSKPTWNPF